MTFDFDPAKSASNRTKHGIDFVDAQQLWEDVNRIEAPARRVRGEERWLLVARLGRRTWSAVFTYRNEKIRIISVRRARAEEVLRYDWG